MDKQPPMTDLWWAYESNDSVKLEGWRSRLRMLAGSNLYDMAEAKQKSLPIIGTVYLLFTV